MPQLTQLLKKAAVGASICSLKTWVARSAALLILVLHRNASCEFSLIVNVHRKARFADNGYFLIKRRNAGFVTIVVMEHFIPP